VRDRPACPFGAGTNPGDSDLNAGYQARAAKDYDRAIAAFRKGLEKQPSNAKAHKDLAYTFLKLVITPQRAMSLSVRSS